MHVIIFGGNDVIHLLAAFARYTIGVTLEESGALREPYEDPVPFESVFEIVDSVSQLSLDTLLKVSWQQLDLIVDADKPFCPPSTSELTRDQSAVGLDAFFFKGKTYIYN